MAVAQTTALKLSWTAPGSFGQDDEGTVSTLREYQIYLQASSELGVGQTVDVTGTPNYTTGETEYTIAAVDLDGGTEYRLAVVVVNSEGATSEAIETVGTTHDLTAAPAAVAQIHVDVSHKVPNEIKIYWEPISGKDKNGNAVAAVYEIYKGESSNGYTDAQNLINRVGSPYATQVSTTETVNEEVKVAQTIKGLVSNIGYDIVVIAAHGEIAELKSLPTLEALVLSNGISQFSLLRGQVPLEANAKVELEVGEVVTLNVEMELHNVSTEIQWDSEDLMIASVVARSAGTETADITAEGAGEVILRATSEADATKFAEVTITVRETDISGSTLSYVSNVDVQKGVSKEVSIYHSTIPDEADIVYTLEPTIAGVALDPNSGKITADGTLGEGEYTFTVVATASVDDASYTGVTRSNQIALWVQESKIVFKPISVESRNIFSAGDVDNPWLFVVRELNSEVGISADIRITDRGEPPVVLYEQTGIQASSLVDGGEIVVGFGPSTSASSWAAINTDELRIEAVVYANAVEFEHRILDVERGVEGSIYSWRDLQKMRDDLAGHYVIQNNIDFPVLGMYGFPVTGFEPIGRDGTKGNDGFQGTAFSGTLDGGGYSIRGLVVDDAELDYVGLFGKIHMSNETTEVVKDLVIENPRINANAMAGALAGFLKKGSVVRVAVRSTKETSGVWTDGTVVPTDGSFLSAGGHAGGLVGVMELGRILQCSSEVPVTGSSNFVGGLVGYNQGQVTGYAMGNVSGKTGVGGLLGYNVSSNVSFAVMGYARGNVSGENNVGGLVGYNQGQVTGYAMGDVSGYLAVGGLIGVNQDAKVTGYATGNVSGVITVGGLTGRNQGMKTNGYVRGTIERVEPYSFDFGLLYGSGEGKGYYSLVESSFVGIDKYEAIGFSGTFIAMKEDTTKEAFDELNFISGPWLWVSDGQWPAIDIGIISPKEEQPTERSDSPFIEDACVAAADNKPEYNGGIYQIDRWQELQWMENCLDGSYRLIADITMPALGQEGMSVKGFNPVGNGIKQFTGYFDGGGYSISGLSIARSESNYVGLFGYMYEGRVENLHIEHSGIEGKNYVGAVAGYAVYSEIKEVSMESRNNEVISATSELGGLVGYNANGTVTGYVTGDVLGAVNYIGGLVGYNTKGTVTGYVTGDVSGDSRIGGLVGYSIDGTVTGYVMGDVSGNSWMGGLVGWSYRGKCVGYVGGDVSGASSYIGGLTGRSQNSRTVGYMTGMVSSEDTEETKVGALTGYADSPTVSGFWNQVTMNNGGSLGIGISSIENIYYYTALSEPSGREQYMYYDKGTGTDPNIQDAEDVQIFNGGDFEAIFEFPEADGVWPKLKESFTVGDRTIVLPKAIYDAQEGIVNWPTE